MTLTIGVDIGGTKIAAGVVDPDGKLLEKLKVASPATDPEAVEEAVAGLVHELTSRHQVTAVGLSAAGYIDAGRSTVMFAPNLAWRDEPLRDDVAERVELPVVVENDGNAAAPGGSSGSGPGQTSTTCCWWPSALGSVAASS
jgi:glucokinase